MAKDKEIKVNVEDLEETPQRVEEDAAEEKDNVSEEEGARESGEPSPEESNGGDNQTAGEISVEEKLARLDDKLLRTMAEFDNYRKRSLQQFEQIRRTANDELLLEILEVLDNFERALQHAEENSHDDALLKGTELIYNQLRGVLARRNVKAIESLGQPFDPNLHDAMMQTASDEYDEGTVAIEISKGYMVGDRVLRHAKVAVSSGPAGDESDADTRNM